MKLLASLVVASSIVLAGPAAGQAMDHSMMPGMKMPAPKSTARPKASAKPKATVKPKASVKPTAPSRVARQRPAAKAVAPAKILPADPACPPEHAAMGHCKPAAAAAATDPHAGHDMTATPDAAQAANGEVSSVGNAPAPAAPAPTYADRIWGAEAMQESRETLRREHGGSTFSQIMVDIAELQIRHGREGFRWEGEGWFGGDIDRLVVKTEGEGSFGRRLDDAEVQALYSRAIGPYFNLQGGVRQDIRPTPSRTYAAVGIEGLAPYWFEVEAHAFVSTKGDVLARLAASYDQRITQRLILQPRGELNFAAQEVRETGTGSGLSDAELDLRLRYEIRREFAPYVGVSWGRKIGDTARFARAAGEDTGGFNLVFGVRAWF